MSDFEIQRTQPPSMGACCALGNIRYPEASDHPGVLIYLRPDLDGTEPLDVRSYAARHSSLFPREHIASRRFDEDGAESYRALGSHIVDTLCQRKRRSDVEKTTEEFSPKELAQRVHEYLAARRAFRMASERSAEPHQ